MTVPSIDDDLARFKESVEVQDGRAMRAVHLLCWRQIVEREEAEVERFVAVSRQGARPIFDEEGDGERLTLVAVRIGESEARIGVDSERARLDDGQAGFLVDLAPDGILYRLT
jgi:hypothetical protein